MRTVLPFVLVVLFGALAAWVVFRSAPEEATDAGREDDLAADGGIDDPTFYRHLDPRERIEAANKRIATMATTAIAASAAGPTKDELALLATHEDVVDLIVDRFRARSGAAETSAFMEIFSRVKHPRFGPLVNEGLRDESFEALSNALRAAAVQADPVTVPALGALLSRSIEIGHTPVVKALDAVGTQDAYALLAARLPDLEHDPALEALLALGGIGYTEAVPAIRARASTADPVLRVVALGTLGRLGQSEGFDGLEEVVLDAGENPELRAQALQILGDLGAPGAVAVARSVKDSPDPYVASEAMLILVRARDPELLSELEEALTSADPGARSRALGLLGGSGHPDDLRLVAATFDRLSPTEQHTFLTALTRAKTPGAAPFIADLARDGRHPWSSAIQALARLGDDALPELEALVREVGVDDHRIDDLVVALGSLPSAEARRVLESLETRDRRLWIGIRRAIRAIDLALLKSGA